ncbi:MAG: NAD-binding protein [Armatimonadetes bacterium]|nr:NAD-binding protein [Armatimonadota bacterium]
MEKPRIGFIGLGIMGRPQCRNLLNAGYRLTIWNRSRPGIEVVVGYGAQEGASPADVAARSDATITMVTDSPDVQQVVLGPNGVIEGARPGSVVIDMTTMSPKMTREIAAALAARGIDMLDAPVSGGEIGAIQGTLSIMVGGKEEVFNRCRPILEAMGKNIVYIGGHGTGQTVKLCNQVVAVLNILGMCECLMLAAKSGVDPRRMLQAVTQGAAGSWMLTHLAPRILKGDFDPGFMIRLQQKDLRLALELADEIKLPLPGTALMNQLFRAVEAEDGGDLGTQTAIKALEKLANFRIQPSTDS